MKCLNRLIFWNVQQEVEGLHRSDVGPDERDKQEEYVVNRWMWAVSVHVSLFVSGVVKDQNV